MKKCPYCAEEIQDEAIKCRYCFSDLTVPPEVTQKQTPAAAANPVAAAPAEARPVAAEAVAGEADPSEASVPEPAPSPATELPDETDLSGPPADPLPAGSASTVRYTHSGYRYVLGYGDDYFGMWDRQAPATPVERWPRTDDGWRAAWLRFIAAEPNHVPVPQEDAPAAAGPDAPAPGDDDAVQYTHSGSRYLLGYGKTFFGIWDRQSPAKPVERFPRTDDGWSAAWQRFTAIETNYAEVSLGGATGTSGSSS